jgi:hypothetical protein
MKALLPFFLALFFTGSALAQDPGEPVLDKYIFGVGQNSDSIAAALHDRFLGNGTALVGLFWMDSERRANADESSSTLAIVVSRTVKPGQIVFALLCDRVELRGFDADGNQVYSKDLEGFVFGDSAGGRYKKTLRDLPLIISRLEITFLGNYE